MNATYSNQKAGKNIILNYKEQCSPLTDDDLCIMVTNALIEEFPEKLFHLDERSRASGLVLTLTTIFYTKVSTDRKSKDSRIYTQGFHYFVREVIADIIRNSKIIMGDDFRSFYVRNIFVKSSASNRVTLMTYIYTDISQWL